MSISTEFVDAAACGDLDGVKNLLALDSSTMSPEIVNLPDKDGRTAFHYACLNDDVPLLTILLADTRTDVLAKSPKGDTGLHMAALYAALEALALLHADGRVDVCSKNNFGDTPLHLCAGSGDKGAAKAASLLLSHGAKLTEVDNWNRGPLDVSHDNAENPLVITFTEYLNAHPEEKEKVDAITAAYKAETSRTNAALAESQQARSKMASISLFGQMGTIKLKKTNTVEKNMFKKHEGDVTKEGAARALLKSKVENKDARRPLSKLVDFPGDQEGIYPVYPVYTLYIPCIPCIYTIYIIYTIYTL